MEGKDIKDNIDEERKKRTSKWNFENIALLKTNERKI